MPGTVSRTFYVFSLLGLTKKIHKIVLIFTISIFKMIRVRHIDNEY